MGMIYKIKIRASVQYTNDIKEAMFFKKRYPNVKITAFNKNYLNGGNK